MTAVPTALEAHERVGGHAATRQSVLVRAVIASYTQPTQIEIPIPELAQIANTTGRLGGLADDSDQPDRVTIRIVRTTPALLTSPLPQH